MKKEVKTRRSKKHSNNYIPCAREAEKTDFDEDDRLLQHTNAGFYNNSNN